MHPEERPSKPKQQRPPSFTKIPIGPIDISDETDSGADDTVTSNDDPSISITGEPGLTIAWRVPTGNPSTQPPTP